MNRRAFIRTAGTTTAVAATMGLRTRTLYGQSAPDPNIYGAAVASHAIASGNAMYAGASYNDWYTIQNTLNNCLGEWRSNNRDAVVRAAVSSVNPASIVTSSLDHQSILQTIQMYHPQFQLTDVQQAVAFIDNNQSLVPSVLTGLQSEGMSHYILVLANQAGQIGAYLQSGGTSTAAQVRRGVTPAMRPPIEPPGWGDGGGGYSCATDGAFIFAAGIAFATIFVMTLGAAAPLAGLAWGGIAAFGGLGVTGWGIGHAVAGCKF